MSKQYRCIQDCCQNFAGRRYWKQDMIAVVEDDVEVPGCFELVGVERFVPPVINETDTLSGIQKKQKELSTPKAGFAANLDEQKPEQKSKSKKR